jgi:hypothetical protein
MTIFNSFLYVYQRVSCQPSKIGASQVPRPEATQHVFHSRPGYLTMMAPVKIPTEKII